MLEQITKLLADLAEARAAKEVLRLDKEAAIASVIPPEVRAALDDIEAEYGDRDLVAGYTISDLELRIKALVAEHGATVKAAGINAVYTAGRVTWDSKALDGFALNHPELFAFRREGKPSVSLRSA